jgi:DNA-binding MarR family transcriptional regulator
MVNRPYSADNPMPLEESIPFRVAVAANLNASIWQRQHARRYGLTITDWRVLMLLVTRPGLSAREVAEFIAVDKMSITRSVRRLLARKYIKVAMNSRDRRRLELSVRPAGAAIYDEVVGFLLQHQAQLLQDFSVTERLMLTELLGKLVEALRRIASALDAA